MGKGRESNGQVGVGAAKKSFQDGKPPAQARSSFFCCFGQPQAAS